MKKKMRKFTKLGQQIERKKKKLSVHVNFLFIKHKMTIPTWSKEMSKNAGPRTLLYSFALSNSAPADINLALDILGKNADLHNNNRRGKKHDKFGKIE